MAFNSNPTRGGWLILAIPFVLSACMRSAEFEVPPVAPRVVLGAHFAPGVPWRIQVTKTRSLNDPQQSPALEDAKVEILENGRPVALARFEKSFFPGTNVIRKAEYAADYPVVPGISYGVRVSGTDYPVAEGEDMLPASPGPAPELTILSLGVNPSLRIRVRLRDVHSGPDYFHLLFFIRQRSDTVTINPFPVFRDLLNGGQVSATDIGGVPLFAGEWHGILIEDKNFSDNERVLTLDLGPESLALDTRRDEFELRAELRAVSKAYYDYYLTATRQLEVQGNAFAEPVRIFNNVTGGFGNVSGYVPVYSPWVVVR